MERRPFKTGTKARTTADMCPTGTLGKAGGMDMPLAGLTHHRGAVIYQLQHLGTVTASPCPSFLLWTDLEWSEQKMSRGHTGCHDPGWALLTGQRTSVSTSCPTATVFSRPLVTHMARSETSGCQRKSAWHTCPEI